MNLQQVLSFTRRAVEDYQMIADGDRIAIGISGGKDSLTLLHALHGLRRFYPRAFDIHAVTVDLGFENLRLDEVARLCADLSVPYEVLKTDIAEVVFEKRCEQNPCSLCAKMRKGALNDFARTAGLNKVAYGHHRDDAIETLLLSLIFEGRLHTLGPVTYLDRADIHVIRPLIYMKETDVIGFVRQMCLPVVKSPCPVDGHTKREYAKELLRSLNAAHPGIRERMFAAVRGSGIEGWGMIS